MRLAISLVRVTRVVLPSTEMTILSSLMSRVGIVAVGWSYVENANG